MNFILFGPPGIGKSTIIGKLKGVGVRALDLEDLYPSKLRFNLLNQVDNLIVGAADLNPARKYFNTKKILLIAEQDIYDQRRSDRDKTNIGKADQRRHLISDWTKANYDLVLDTSKLDADASTQAILSFMRKEGYSSE